MRYFGGAVEAESFDDAVARMRRRIGDNPRTLREMRGLSLDQVSAGCGTYTDDKGRTRPRMTSETIRNYEKGTYSNYENYWLLADFYSVTLGTLGGRVSFEPSGEVA